MSLGPSGLSLSIRRVRYRALVEGLLERSAAYLWSWVCEAALLDRLVLFLSCTHFL